MMLSMLRDGCILMCAVVIVLATAVIIGTLLDVML